MNKFLKGAVCAGLCCSMLAAVGCKKAKLDPEKRQLTLATAALDGNFNPFFYTSQNDGNMISMTQISMLTVDSDGRLRRFPQDGCPDRPQYWVPANGKL